MKNLHDQAIAINAEREQNIRDAAEDFAQYQRNNEHEMLRKTHLREMCSRD